METVAGGEPSQGAGDAGGLAPSKPKMPFIASIDGLRAIAVVAVLLFHAEIDWIPGGFLGVEVFFVVSGYLITALLLGEIDRTGRVDLRDFWIRRARRLLPALGFYLLGSLALALALADDVVDDWIDGSWAAVLYVANWFAVFNDISYTEAFGRPSFLHHLWSLAVEEQFYLLWPLLMIGGLRFLGRRYMLVAIGVGIVASTALMWVLYEPLADPLRIYYGTDTRAAGLLVGAALAFLWRPWEHPVGGPEIEQRRQRTALALTALGLVGVIRAFLVYDLSPIEADPLFRGGFLITSISTAALIAGLTLASSSLSNALAGPVMRWLGSRSYGLYLWHWPIFMVTRPRIDTELDGPVLLLFRFILTFLVAEISYQLVEQPFRRGFRRDSDQTLAETLRPLARPAALGVVTVLAVSIVLVDLQRDDKTDVVAIDGVVPEELAADAPTITTTTDSDTTSTVATPDSAAPLEPLPGSDSPALGVPVVTERVPEATDPVASETVAPETVTPETVAPETTTTVAPPASGLDRITFVGDSVMRGAVPILETFAPTVNVDTNVGRQWWDAETVVRDIGQNQGFGDAVVIHLGNNGAVNAAMFDGVMGSLRGVDRVVVVNVRVPARWEGIVNAELTASVPRWDNAVLVDWYSLSNGQPGFFTNDSVHLQPPGQRAYAQAILDALAV